MTTWTEFTQRLATTLQNLRAMEYLIISADDGTAGYVQFFRDVNQLIAEPAAEVYAPTMDTGPPCTSTTGSCRCTRRRTGCSPSSSPPIPSTPRSSRTSPSAAAEHCRTPTASAPPDVLVHTAWRDSGNHPLELPELGLRRESPA